MTSVWTGIAISTLLAMVSASLPAASGEPFAVKSMEDFLDYQYALRDAVESGKGRFAELAKVDRSKLLRAQDDIFRILDGKTSVKRLSERDKKTLYNAQHVVAAIVTGAGDDMNVCRSVNDIGTHLTTVECRTTAEVRATGEDNRERFGKLQQCRGADCSP